MDSGWRERSKILFFVVLVVTGERCGGYDGRCPRSGVRVFLFRGEIGMGGSTGVIAGRLSFVTHEGGVFVGVHGWMTMCWGEFLVRVLTFQVICILVFWGEEIPISI
jgi:hypothetical protein